MNITIGIHQPRVFEQHRKRNVEATVWLLTVVEIAHGDDWILHMVSARNAFGHDQGAAAPLAAILRGKVGVVYVKRLVGKLVAKTPPHHNPA